MSSKASEILAKRHVLNSLDIEPNQPKPLNKHLIGSYNDNHSEGKYEYDLPFCENAVVVFAVIVICVSAIDFVGRRSFPVFILHTDIMLKALRHSIPMYDTMVSYIGITLKYIKCVMTVHFIQKTHI